MIPNYLYNKNYHFLTPNSILGNTNESEERKLSWELGVLIYKLIYGKYPFSREYKTLNEVFKQIFFNDIVLKTNIVNTSDLCNSIIVGLLNKDFTHRLSLHDSIFESWFNEM